MDNQSIKGIRDDETVPRQKKRGGKKKPFAIESRIKRHVSNDLARKLMLHDWWVYRKVG
jgi:hypothetical protein